MIIKEEDVWDKFGGQMNLCDFGAFMSKCPGGDGCTGPMGTQYEPKRLYSWGQWVGRIFVKDSLSTLFPDMRDQIAEKIDVGEYGVEDYWCRIVCIFTFLLGMMEELLHILRTIRLLYLIPSRSESWIRFDGPIDNDITIDRMTADKSLTLAVKGMPWHWKVINVVTVLFPKIFIFRYACQVGVRFLMETSAIQDVIINAVALQFIMQIDNMVYGHLMGRTSQVILDQLADFDGRGGDDVTVTVTKAEKPALERGLMQLLGFFNGRIEAVIILTVIFVVEYYMVHCILRENGGWIGGWISKPEFYPKSVDLNPQDAFFSPLFKESTEDAPYWKMPSPSR
jgi:hypothetical protein